VFPKGPLPFAVVSETPKSRRPTTGPVQYKGADLEPDRGPGLGCFRFQVVLLVVLILLTPISVYAGAPDWLSAAFLFLTIILLLFTGQTVIFLLRLVAADRRGRRRPLASGTPTVGEIEDSRLASETPADLPVEPPKPSPEAGPEG